MTATTNSSPQHEFAIQRIYVKDISLESPNTPELFQQPWQPEADVQINSRNREIQAGQFEVVLSITLTTKVENKTAFLVEIQQAGLFVVKNFDAAQLDHLLRSFIPNILFPYARAAITSTVIDAGFPPVYLAPVNFEAVYQQQLQQEQANAGNTVKVSE